MGAGQCLGIVLGARELIWFRFRFYLLRGLEATSARPGEFSYSRSPHYPSTYPIYKTVQLAMENLDRTLLRKFLSLLPFYIYPPYLPALPPSPSLPLLHVTDDPL